MFTNKSVVLTSYNGSKYIEQQILSILPQLLLNDELIVIDDCSQDNTIEIIERINDPRIFIHINDKNIGVIKSFERGLTLSKYDVIFLSDQDDLWLDNKVSLIIAEFENNDAIGLVYSDAIVIDGDGIQKYESFMRLIGGRRKSIFSNFVKNTFLGCTIAIRRDLLKVVLPFPDRIPMHDSWIGILAMIFSKVKYMEMPLIRYRRHDKNVSAVTRASLVKVIVWRFNLLREIFIRYIRLKKND